MSGSSTDRFGRLVNTHVSHYHHVSDSNDRRRKSFFSVPSEDIVKKQVGTLQNKVEQLKSKEKQFQSKLANIDKILPRRLDGALKSDVIDLKANTTVKFDDIKTQLDRVNSRIAILVINVQNLNDDFREKLALANADIIKISLAIDALGLEAGPSQIKFGRRTLSEVKNAASDFDAINYFQYKLFSNELHKKIAAQQTVLEQQKNIISSHTDLIARSLVENISDSSAFLAKNRRITSVAPPIDASDATNLLFLQEFVLKQITELEDKINKKISNKAEEAP